MIHDTRRRATLLVTTLGLAAIGVTAAQASSGAMQDERTEEVRDARELINEAAGIVREMKADPGVLALLRQAKGVYLVPEFGRGGLIVGARGGSGLVTMHRTDGWTAPLFYNLGGISVGLQAGGSGGRLAFLLMSDDAVAAFANRDSVSLNAGAGLSIINYSANAQASQGKGDIVLWSDTAGAYAGATISLSDIVLDTDTNRSIYGADVQPAQVLEGRVAWPQPDQLRTVLP